MDRISHREDSTTKGTKALNNDLCSKTIRSFAEWNAGCKGYGTGRWSGNNAVEVAIKLPCIP